LEIIQLFGSLLLNSSYNRLQR